MPAATTSTLSSPELYRIKMSHNVGNKKNRRKKAKKFFFSNQVQIVLYFNGYFIFKIGFKKGI